VCHALFRRGFARGFPQKPAFRLPAGFFSAIRAAFDRPADKGCRGDRALLPESKTLAKPPQGALAL
jgi:hypothetical protein